MPIAEACRKARKTGNWTYALDMVCRKKDKTKPKTKPTEQKRIVGK